ncbi:MFS transporter [Paenibacillus segetis]|uniref:MFS transporter n=1 Tax=Paenibacillus segetis TaxID=1325360 RepID=A0ABQ1YIA7_9BACL|nr:MFS transporter [Paenibacillus segetis]GGH26942.1 MFS transporter [Paenibacillus segetis]
MIEQRMERSITYKDLLTQRQYLKLIAANVINRFGDSVDTIAFSLMVYTLTGSATWVALIFGCNALPTILFQPFAGAIVEGLNKKYTMVISDIGRGFVVGITAILLISGLLNPWILLALTFMNSTLESLRIPAGIAIVPKILDKSLYTHGLSLNSTMQQTVGILGLAVAAAIIGVFGIGTAILIDAITFIASAIIILFIQTSEDKQERIKLDLKGYLHTLSEGFFYLKQAKVVFAICILGGFMSIFFIPINAMMAPYTTDTLGLSSIGMSVAGICSTIGMGTGAFLFPTLRKRFTARNIFILGGMMIGVCYLIWVGISFYADHISLIYILLAMTMFVFGFFASFIQSVVGVSFMEHIEEKYMSRVGAIFNAIATSTTPLGSLIVAGAMLFLSVNQLFIVTGICTIVLFTGMLPIKVLKQL